LILPLFSQNRISEQELKRYEWIIYSKNVADSSEIFSSDTLLLAKSYELESLEEIIQEDDQRMDKIYPRSWRIDFSRMDLESTDQRNEFYVFFIDLRKAASRRTMEVDSITYQLLQNPNELTSETSPVLLELKKMQNGDVIQIVGPIHDEPYYIEKKGNKLQVLKTLRSRYIFEPKGINQGFWTFSKSKQLITFSDGTGGIKFHFWAERIDNFRIRMVRLSNTP
jgi:hypothetical protein